MKNAGKKPEIPETVSQDPRNKEMKVLVMGMGRTGTTALASGLQQMGFTPYDYVDRFNRGHLHLWDEAMRAKFQGRGKAWTREDFDRVTGDYDCILDVPCCFFAEDLSRAYPNAKVILNTRDPNDWLRSMERTLFTVFQWRSWQILRYTGPDVCGAWCRHNEVIWNHFCDGEYKNGEKCKKRFLEQYTTFMNQHPDRPAVVSVQQRDDFLFTAGGKAQDTEGCVRYTFRELHQHATRLASALYAQDLGPQQSLATFLPNSAEFAIALLAATLLNVSFVPLDPRSLTRPDEIGHYLQILKPSALIVSDEHDAERVDAIDGSSGLQKSLKILIVSAPVTKSGWSDLKNLLDGTSEQNTTGMLERGLGAANMDTDIALTILTSGTSGLPKACPLTCKNVASFTDIPKSVRRMEPKDRCLQQFPVSHIGAIGPMLQAWAAGACVVIPSPYFDAQASLHAVEHEKCTRMLAIPTIIDQLLSLPSFSPEKVRSLDHVALGATMVSPEDLKKCRDPAGFGAEVVTPAYWMTEALALVAWGFDED